MGIPRMKVMPNRSEDQRPLFITMTQRAIGKQAEEKEKEKEEEENGRTNIRRRRKRRRKKKKN